MQYPTLAEVATTYSPLNLTQWSGEIKMPVRPVILIVDDDATIRGLLEDFLALEGYRTIGAANGQAALERIKQLQVMEGCLPGLIISDIRMPAMDGLELARHLQGDRLLGQISVVLVSAAANFNMVTTPLDNSPAASSAFSFPKTTFIAKPFDLDKVALTVRQLLLTPKNKTDYKTDWQAD